MDSTTWDERHAGTEYLWKVAPNRFVEEHLAGLPPGIAIDVGAGEGRNAVWLALRGWQVTAVDFSEVGLDKARRLAAEHERASSVDLVRADVLDYQPGESVDLVLVSYLQLPAEQVRTVLSHAVSWLKPGGTLMVVAHDRSNVTQGYGGPSREEVCYDLDTTVAALSGLDITTSTVARREVETPEGPRMALDTLVVGTRPQDASAPGTAS